MELSLAPRAQDLASYFCSKTDRWISLRPSETRLLCSVCALLRPECTGLTFKSSLSELVGARADKETIKKAKSIAEARFSSESLEIVDIAVLKTGRTYSVAVFVNQITQFPEKKQTDYRQL